VAFAAPKPSINTAATANDELANLITYPFNVESVNQLDAAALVPTNQDEETPAEAHPVRLELLAKNLSQCTTTQRTESPLGWSVRDPKPQKSKLQ